MSVEASLRVSLVERRDTEVLPGWSTLPYRRLHGFDPGQHLVVRVDPSAVGVFEREIAAAKADDAALTALVRWSLDQWQRRSGVAANRLVIAFDRRTPADLANRVRNVALQASMWRVVGLCRDDDRLAEVLLSPPPERRPAAGPADGPTSTGE